MKNLIISFYIILILSTNIFSQLTLSPNPQLKGICPGVNSTFTISGISTNCSGFSLVKDGGDFTLTGPTTSSGYYFRSKC